MAVQMLLPNSPYIFSGPGTKGFSCASQEQTQISISKAHQNCFKNQPGMEWVHAVSSGLLRKNPSGWPVSLEIFPNISSVLLSESHLRTSSIANSISRRPHAAKEQLEQKTRANGEVSERAKEGDNEKLEWFRTKPGRATSKRRDIVFTYFAFSGTKADRLQELGRAKIALLGTRMRKSGARPRKQIRP